MSPLDQIPNDQAFGAEHVPIEDGASVMPLGDHIEELRRRLLLVLVGLVPIAITALVFGRPLLALLIAPAQDALIEASLNPTLQATSPMETFATYVKIAIISAILLGSPWLLFQLWKFVAPGLYAHERRFVYLLLPMSALLTACSVLFLYRIILPVVLAFFIGFGSELGARSTPTVEPDAALVFPSVPVLAGDPIEPAVGHEWINTELQQRRVCTGYEDGQPVILGSDLIRAAGVAQQYRVSEYTSMFLSLTMAFAVAFQTPVVVLLLGWAGLIDRSMLVRYRKHIAMICMVLSAVLTPADPVSMVLLGVPLYFLFELGSILLVLLPAERVARGLVKPELSADERAQPSSAGAWQPPEATDDRAEDTDHNHDHDEDSDTPSDLDDRP